jgi:hypothetical protein
LNRWSWRFFQFLPQGKWPWCNPRRQCSTWQGWLPRWGSNVEGRTFFSLCIGSLQHLFLFSGSIAEGLSFILGQARFILLTDWLTASFDSSLKLPQTVIPTLQPTSCNWVYLVMGWPWLTLSKGLTSEQASCAGQAVL